MVFVGSLQMQGDWVYGDLSCPNGKTVAPQSP